MPGAGPDPRNTVSHRWLRHPVEGSPRSAPRVSRRPPGLLHRRTPSRGRPDRAGLPRHVQPRLTRPDRPLAVARQATPSGSAITPGDGVVIGTAPDPITASKLSGKASHSDKIAKHMASGTYVGHFYTVPGTPPTVGTASPDMRDPEPLQDIAHGAEYVLARQLKELLVGQRGKVCPFAH